MTNRDALILLDTAMLRLLDGTEIGWRTAWELLQPYLKTNYYAALAAVRPLARAYIQHRGEWSVPENILEWEKVLGHLKVLRDSYRLDHSWPEGFHNDVLEGKYL